jgi:hypothetical protein
LNEIVEPGWAKALEPVAENIASMGEFLRAFQQPLDKVRVLIVGQDPYPTPGQPAVRGVLRARSGVPSPFLSVVGSSAQESLDLERRFVGMFRFLVGLVVVVVGPLMLPGEFSGSVRTYVRGSLFQLAC